MKLVLASSSPRRHELLTSAGLSFMTVHSPAKEIHDASMKPWELCEHNATIKALTVAPWHGTSVVLGADTLVFLDNEPIGKPEDLADAHRMLRRLSGRTHQVCTGVCLMLPGGDWRTFHEISDVTFLTLDDTAIAEYHQLVNPLDKAGAYGIQEHQHRIVENISGDFHNVMGLPLAKTLRELAEVGISPT